MPQVLIFITTCIIQFLIAIEMNLVGPLSPFLAQYYNLKSNQVILLNLGFSAVGILVPFLGIFSDRYGKKKMINIAVILFIIGTIISGLSKTPILFAFGRIFIGIGYYTLSGTNLSYVSEFISYENRGKASGILRIAFGAAVLFTPVYATTLVTKFNNIQSVYLPLTIVAAAALLLLQPLPETKLNTEARFNKQSFIDLLKDKRSLKILVSLIFITVAPTMFLSFLGLNLTNSFQFSQTQVGYVYTLVAIGTLAGISLAAIFTDRIGKLPFSKIAFAIMTLSLWGILFINNNIIYIGLSILFAVGIDGGWTAYQTYASEISTENRGTFMSLFYTMNAVTVFVFSVIGSAMFAIGGFKLTILISAISSVIGFVIVTRLERE